jgi:hypothetical protein
VKGKVVLPAGFKYVLDREAGDSSPTLKCKIKEQDKQDKKVTQSFYLPIEPSGKALPFSFNWQVVLDKTEINFMFNVENIFNFRRIFITDTKEGYHNAEFLELRPTDETFEARTNHFSKPKRLANKVLHLLADEIKLPSVEDTRQCLFYLLKKHEEIANGRILKITEDFLHTVETPKKIKNYIHRMWNNLQPQAQRDGTIK